MFVRECLVADGDLAVTFAFSLLGSFASLALIKSVVAGRLEGNIDLHLFFSLRDSSGSGVTRAFHVIPICQWQGNVNLMPDVRRTAHTMRICRTLTLPVVSSVCSEARDLVRVRALAVLFPD